MDRLPLGVSQSFVSLRGLQRHAFLSESSTNIEHLPRMETMTTTTTPTLSLFHLRIPRRPLALPIWCHQAHHRPCSDFSHFQGFDSKRYWSRFWVRQPTSFPGNWYRIRCRRRPARFCSRCARRNERIFLIDLRIRAVAFF